MKLIDTRGWKELAAPGSPWQSWHGQEVWKGSELC